MTTIYTDKLGLYPWGMLIVAGMGFWSAYEAFAEGHGSQLGLGVGSGTVFLTLALKRFWDVRQAKREGRDPAIIRIKSEP